MLELQRHEDRYSLGVPDVSYSALQVNGWIELKECHEWPVRSETVLRIKHYTEDQRGWLFRHGERGGYCWLLLQVGKDYLLFNHLQAQGVGATYTRQDCFEKCTASWQGELPLLKLLEILTRKYHA
jgi:hypothetical protein